MVQMVAELLRNEGHEVAPFTNGNAALEAMESVAPELVITDLYLDKTRAQGLDILNKARTLSPPAIVILMTAFGSIETLTPEVCYPEAPGWPSSYFHSPWPLSENYFLAAFSFDPLPGMGPKVERDTLMRRLDEEFPAYMLASNKGYGTPDHYDALESLGPSSCHRRSFRLKREHADQIDLFADDRIAPTK